MFVKEHDDLSDCFHPVCVVLIAGSFCIAKYQFTSSSKHLVHWRRAIDKVYSWTFLNKESDIMHPSVAYKVGGIPSGVRE
jgi:hypothetical protein